MGNFTLGLDLGTNSIGWALLDFDDNQQPRELIACGSRIFQEAVEAKTGTPKNHARRAARVARKLVARRKQRRSKLLNLLVRHGLLPQDEAERNTLLLDNQANNPYQLRKRGLDEKLEPFAFGRALYHLAHRRGFQSNRKAASDEDGKVKTAISALRAEMQDRTLGAFLADQPTQRRRYTDRAMYAEEFEQLWGRQALFAPEQLTQALKVAIHNSIFFQRPLKSQKHLVGKCAFEPTRKRAAKAILLAQRFRILQDVNHLAVKNPITREFRPLSQDERNKLAEALDKQKSMTWGAVRKVVGWNKKDSLHEGETFNLEEGKKDKLLGNRTACDLRGALGDRWDALAAQQQDDLVTDLLTIDNEQGFLNRMKNHWNFDDTTAEALAKIELEPGYARLSTKAMRAILPYLEQGLNYQLSTFMAYSACPNEKKKTILDLITTKRMKFDKACELVDWKEVTSYQSNDKLGLPPNVRNPVVQKALFETRKVVNAIVRKYGKPAVIRVEMARDMKLTLSQKETVHAQNKLNEEANKHAAQKLFEIGLISSPDTVLAKPDDLIKYRLWEECNGICPYTGKPISMGSLFGSEIDVEHIIPLNVSLNNSFANKTLCYDFFNRQIKRNKTPFECLSGNEEQYLEVLQRVEKFKKIKIVTVKKVKGKLIKSTHESANPKIKLFERKEAKTDEFVSRQLNDTRYICREVKDFLLQLGIEVEISKGGTTAMLRGRWKLNTLLHPDSSNEKNRADHRHHAIDAVVIALTNRSLFHKLSRLSAQSISLDKSRFDVPLPWDGFYDDVSEKIGQVIVSYAPARKISGALHKETAYGYSESEKCFVTRKSLDQKRINKLTESEVKKIRDAKVRELVESHLVLHGGDFKKAMGQPLFQENGITPIKSVRVTSNFNKDTTHPVKKGQSKDYKFFTYGNNHHVEILENIETGNREGRFVTAMEAARRARGAANTQKSGIVQRDHGAEWKFIASFSINDIVQVASNGAEIPYRIQAISEGNQFEITLKRLNDALSDKNENTLRIRSESALKQILRKLAVDPLGNVAPCND